MLQTKSLSAESSLWVFTIFKDNTVDIRDLHNIVQVAYYPPEIVFLSKDKRTGLGDNDLMTERCNELD